MAKGIDYVPDFLINSAGVICHLRAAVRVGRPADRGGRAVASVTGSATSGNGSRTTGRTPL